MDLQRNAEGIALIGDPRNDSHVLMSQLHLAMLKAHNTFVDEARLSGATNAFEEAARQLCWHYQWVVLNEFPPALVGQTLTEQVLQEARSGFARGRVYSSLEHLDHFSTSLVRRGELHQTIERDRPWRVVILADPSGRERLKRLRRRALASRRSPT